MKFGLNKILNLYFMTDRLMYDPGLLDDPAYADKAVNSKENFKEFLGSYGQNIVNPPEGEGRNLYLGHAMAYFRENDISSVSFQNNIVKKALLLKLDFLPHIQEPPVIGVLEWLANQEELFGAEHDLPLADQIVPKTDPDVMQLELIKVNFAVHMAKYGIEVPVLR